MLPNVNNAHRRLLHRFPLPLSPIMSKNKNVMKYHHRHLDCHRIKWKLKNPLYSDVISHWNHLHLHTPSNNRLIYSIYSPLHSCHSHIPIKTPTGESRRICSMTLSPRFLRTRINRMRTRIPTHRNERRNLPTCHHARPRRRRASRNLRHLLSPEKVKHLDVCSVRVAWTQGGKSGFNWSVSFRWGNNNGERCSLWRDFVILIRAQASSVFSSDWLQLFSV